MINSVFLTLFISCNSKPNNSLESESKKSTIDTLLITSKNNNVTAKIKIDSVRMHAFDNLYFGTQSEIISKKFSINDMDYVVKSSQSVPGKGLCYFMLENQSNITTKRKANKVLNELKNTISKKYNGALILNKTYYIKHPEEMEKNETFFDLRATYKYDKKIIGLPYEFVACKWNQKYKEIQIGYFIDHKDKTVMFQSSPENDYYIIYIEITSKLIKPEKENSSNKQIVKDSNKF